MSISNNEESIAPSVSDLSILSGMKKKIGIVRL